MRKISGTVTVTPFGNGGRLTIASQTGEIILVDLNRDELQAHYQQTEVALFPPKAPQRAPAPQPEPAPQAAPAGAQANHTSAESDIVANPTRAPEA